MNDRTRSLCERAAKALGWSEQDAMSFSLPSLRELVRDKDKTLAQDISECLRTGAHIVSDRTHTRTKSRWAR